MVKTSNIDNKGKRRKSAKLVAGMGHDCAFPFKFKGKVYDNECVKGDTGDWCATSKTKTNYTNTWGYCVKENSPKPKTPRKSSSKSTSKSRKKSSNKKPINNTKDLEYINHIFHKVFAKITYDTPKEYKCKTLILGYKILNGRIKWRIMSPNKDQKFKTTYDTPEEAFESYKNKRESINKKYEVIDLGGLDDEGIQNKIQELKYKPVDIKKCKNDTNDIGLGEEWKDVDIKKIINLSNGNCYNIDELAGYIISQKGKNVDPLNSLTGQHSSLWENEGELLEIRNYPGIDSDIKKEFQNVMDKTLAMLRMPVYVKFLNTPKGKQFMDKLIVTGKICTEDYTGDFSPAQLELSRMREYIKDNLNSEERDMIKEISTFNGLKLEGVLIKDTGDTCIHGIGFQLLSLYFSSFVKTRQVYKDLDDDFNLTLHKGIVDLGNDTFIYCHGGERSSYKGGINYPLTGLIFDTKNLTSNGQRNGGTGRLVNISKSGNIREGSLWGFGYKYADRKIKDYKTHLNELINKDKDNLLNIFADRPQVEKPHGKLSPIIKCKDKFSIGDSVLNDRKKQLNKSKNKYKNLKENGRMIKITETGKSDIDGIYCELNALTNKKEAYIRISPFNYTTSTKMMKYFSYCKEHNDWRSRNAKDFKNNKQLGQLRYHDYMQGKVMVNEGYLQNKKWEVWNNEKWELNENVKITRYPEDDVGEDGPYHGVHKPKSSSSNIYDIDSGDKVDEPGPGDKNELTDDEIADLKAKNELPFNGNLQEAMKVQDRSAIKIIMRARIIPAKLLDKKTELSPPQKKDLTDGEIADLKAKNELPYGGKIQEAMKAQDRGAIKIIMRARNITAKKRSSKKSRSKSKKKKENNPLNIEDFLKKMKNINILNNPKVGKLSSSDKPQMIPSPLLINKQNKKIIKELHKEINNDNENIIKPNYIIIKKSSKKSSSTKTHKKSSRSNNSSDKQNIG
jgi:citrate lyase gamma subunit